MKLFTLKCPNCGSSLEIEDGIDTFFCKYCGHKIILEDQSQAAINAKVSVKRMEHEENLTDKKHEQERYKMKMKAKEERRSIAIVFTIFGSIILLCALVLIIGYSGEAKQEEKLQVILEEIMLDINNGDYEAAYIKANTLHWDSSFSSEGKRKWDDTRKAVIKQIDEAKKNANK